MDSVRIQSVVCENDTVLCEDTLREKRIIFGSKVSAVKIYWAIVIVREGSVKNNNNWSKLLLFKLIS